MATNHEVGSSILSGRTILPAFHFFIEQSGRFGNSMLANQGGIMKRILWTLCLLALVRSATDLVAQVNPYKEGTPGVSGYRSEVLAEVMIQEDKFVRLAEAIPADKYTWRPAPDVRSFAEVFLHVSAANYNVYKLVGTPPPTGIDLKTLEKSTTDKAKVIATLRDSFAHAKKAITSMSDADLDKSMDWFGGKNTERGIL